MKYVNIRRKTGYMSFSPGRKEERKKKSAYDGSD
jgi:hypothetical protein